VRLQWSSG